MMGDGVRPGKNSTCFTVLSLAVAKEQRVGSGIIVPQLTGLSHKTTGQHGPVVDMGTGGNYKIIANNAVSDMHRGRLVTVDAPIVQTARPADPAYILWPARVGAFSLVMGRHVNHADTSNLPFSYLIEQQNTTYLVPGVNLRSVGTIRDAQKWPKRDKRTDPNRLDYINYNLLSPYTIQKMFKGRSILKELKRVSGETSEIYSYQSAKIKNSSLNSGIRYYEIAIHKFLGNSIIKRLEGINFKDNEEIRRRLKPDTEIGVGEWVDIAGLIAPKSEVEKLIDGIESGEINRLKSMNACFAAMHDNYYTYEWTWAYHKIQEFYGLNPETITAKDIIAIVRAWREAVVGLDRMVYDDARKEFSLSSMTGFGADGSRDEMKLDFGQVRGDFESNPFVTAVLSILMIRPLWEKN